MLVHLDSLVRLEEFLQIASSRASPHACVCFLQCVRACACVHALTSTCMCEAPVEKAASNMTPASAA